MKAQVIFFLTAVALVAGARQISVARTSIANGGFRHCCVNSSATVEQVEGHDRQNGDRDRVEKPVADDTNVPPEEANKGVERAVSDDASVPPEKANKGVQKHGHTVIFLVTAVALVAEARPGSEARTRVANGGHRQCCVNNRVVEEQVEGHDRQNRDRDRVEKPVVDDTNVLPEEANKGIEKPGYIVSSPESSRPVVYGKSILRRRNVRSSRGRIGSGYGNTRRWGYISRRGYIPRRGYSRVLLGTYKSNSHTNSYGNAFKAGIRPRLSTSRG